MAQKVLFISADQWRASALGFLGHPQALTPNLDRLAGEGVTFLRHYCVTLPCGPSRASLLSGLYAMNHRSVTNGTPLDARLPTLPAVARSAGYDPLLYGYSDTSADPRGLAEDDPRLFTYEGKMEGFSWGMNMNLETHPEWLAYLRDKGYAVPEAPGAMYLPPETNPSKAFNRVPALYRSEDSDMAFLTSKVIEDLEARRHEDWFVHLVYLRPHPPLIAPAPYHTMINAGEIASPIADEEPPHPFIEAWREKHLKAGYFEDSVDFTRLTDDEAAEMRAVYYGLIAEVDAQIGRLLDYLAASGQADETLVIFTCDHGEMLGDHGVWGKGGWYEGAYHIPLIVRDPRQAQGAGRRVEAFTESVDLAPTITDWLGLPQPHCWDGSSLAPWISGGTPSAWRDAAFWEFDFRDVEELFYEEKLGLTPDQCCLSVLRSERWKYVHCAALPSLLYDLENDPEEKRNLARDPGHAAILAEMAGRLLSHRLLHAERTLTNIKLTGEGPVAYEGPRRRA